MTRLVVTGLFVATLLSGCGGSSSIACDEGPYLAAASVPKVAAPQGLDELDPLNELPLPEASPQDPWPEGGPCLDEPPRIIIME